MLTILIVEDSGGRIECFRKYYQGQIVLFARDAEAALEYLQAQPFDIIQLDFMLEGDSTSLRVAEYIRDNKLESLVIIHSTHVGGVGQLQEMLPGAYRIPFSQFEEKVAVTRRLKEAIGREDVQAMREVLDN